MSRSPLIRARPIARAIACTALFAGVATGSEGPVGHGLVPTDIPSASPAASGFVIAQSDAIESALRPESRAEARTRTAEELEAAKARSAAADVAYSRMRRSNHPRGAAKEEILTERMEAAEALAAAQAAYDALHPGGR